MLTRCSPISLYRRFHSFTDGQAYARGLFMPRAGYHTLVAILPALRRAGPLTASVQTGTFSVDLDLGLDRGHAPVQ
jgi:hypothetical protein